jgi:hypothetical protein
LTSITKRTWGEALAWGWLCLGALAALWSHAAIATNALGVNWFDESIRLLQAAILTLGVIIPRSWV